CSTRSIRSACRAAHPISNPTAIGRGWIWRFGRAVCTGATIRGTRERPWNGNHRRVAEDGDKTSGVSDSRALKSEGRPTDGRPSARRLLHAYGAIQATALLIASNVSLASSCIALICPYQILPPEFDWLAAYVRSCETVSAVEPPQAALVSS